MQIKHFIKEFCNFIFKKKIEHVSHETLRLTPDEIDDGIKIRFIKRDGEKSIWYPVEITNCKFPTVGTDDLKYD